MGKIKVYIDFDNTLVNTNKAVVSLLNKKFNKHKRYKTLYKYSFKDLFPESTEEMIGSIFEQQELFDNLEVFDGCREFLSYFQDDIEPTIVQVGSQENINLKEKYFQNSELIVQHLICLYDNGTDKEKQKIDMHDGIMIDDKIDVLRNVNAKIKILFKNGIDAEWNKIDSTDDVYVVNTWEEIQEIIDFYVSHQEVI